MSDSKIIIECGHFELTFHTDFVWNIQFDGIYDVSGMVWQKCLLFRSLSFRQGWLLSPVSLSCPPQCFTLAKKYRPLAIVCTKTLSFIEVGSCDNSTRLIEGIMVFVASQKTTPLARTACREQAEANHTWMVC